MSAILVCPECDKKLRVPDTVIGKAFRCPACKALIPPDSEPDSPAPSRSVKQSPSPRSAAIPSRGRPVREEEPEDDLEPDEEQPVRDKPRRKRPKRKKSSTGLMIGVVAGGAVLLLLVLGCGGGLLWYFLRDKAIPDAEWQTFTPPNSGCTILMPGTPVSRTQTGNGLTLTIYQVDRDRGKTGFALGVMDLTNNVLQPNALEIMGNAQREEMIRRLNGKVTNETSVTLGNIPGREYSLTSSKHQGMLIERIYLAKLGGQHRLYAVIAAGKNVAPNKGDAARFFDSFKLDASAKPPTFANNAAPGGPNPPGFVNPPPANPQSNPPPGIRRPGPRRRP